MQDTAIRQIAAGLSAAALLLLAAPIHALPLDEAADPVLNCVVWLQPLQPGEAVSQVLHSECSDTPSPALLAVLSAASDVRTALIPPLPVPLPVSYDDTLCGDASSDCREPDTVLGIDYEHINYGGSSLVYVGERRCDDGVSYGLPAMPAGWNDVVSSSKGYAGCSLKHWEDIDYAGASQVCTCSSMSAMNDQTSSVEFY